MFPSFVSYFGAGADTIIGFAVRQLSAWIVGSMILTGNIFMDTTSNANPSKFVNTGSVMTIGSTTTTPLPGGGVRLTASGSRNFVANWLVPTLFSGATLWRADIQCGNTFVIATSGSLVANQASLKASITTGTQLRNNIRVATGSTTTANTGATIQTKLLAGHYLSFITNSSGGSAIFGGNAVSASRLDCIMRPIAIGKYGR